MPRELPTELNRAISVEISKIMQPSTDIANSALSLTHNRCDDLDIPPVICWIMLRELCDLNIDQYLKDAGKNAVRTMPGYENVKDKTHEQIAADIKKEMEQLIKTLTGHKMERWR